MNIFILAGNLHETHYGAKGEMVLSVVGTLADKTYIRLKNIYLLD